MAAPYRAPTCGATASGAGELGRTLLREGQHALDEVLGLGALLLEDGLEIEKLVELRVVPLVERPFDRRVGTRGSSGEALRELGDGRLELAVPRDAVDQSPLERPR